MNKAKGFTIIEVMIVLVIAASILLMVFLAVPSLQRSSRNTQRRGDVARIASALFEYSTNNNGTFPADNAAFQSNVVNNVKLSYYTSGNVVWYAFGDGNVLNEVDIVGSNSVIKDSNQKVVLTSGAKCSGVAAAVGSARQFVALYNVETGSGLTGEQCVES